MISIQFLIEVSTTLFCQPKSQIIFISCNYCKLFSKFVDAVSRALVIDTSWVIVVFDHVKIIQLEAKRDIA